MLPGEPVSIGHGQWVTSPATPHLVVHHDLPTDPEAMGLRSCPCTAIEGACLNVAVRRVIDAAAGFSVEWDQPCACFGLAGVNAPDPTPSPVQPVYRSSGFDPDGVPCGFPPLPGRVVSVVAGTLFRIREESSREDECGNDTGTNVYDLRGDRAPLVEGLEVREPERLDWQRCGESELDIDGFVAAETEDRDVLDRWSERDEGEDDGEFGGADPCDEGEDADYLVLRSGRLCRRGVQLTASGLDAYFAACRRLTPDVCPSALDPCGSGTMFGDRLEGADAWWVSTDERFALIFDDGGLVVLVGEPSGPSEIAVEAGVRLEDVVGVLFSPNAAFVAAAMAHDDRPVEAPVDDGACSGDADCRAGLVCDPVALVCRPPCRTDSDCAFQGRCGARCRGDGHCGPEPTGLCDDADFPCAPRYHCVDGVCDSCRNTDDCGEGVCREGRCEVQCRGPGGCDGAPCVHGRCVSAEPFSSAPVCEAGIEAARFGDLCWREIGAARWDEAERLCRCGLAASPAPRTRGAILYNLGRIAEERGDVPAARAFYQQSLEVRGENAEVRRRLEALPGP